MAAAVRTSAVCFVGDADDVGAELIAVPETAFVCGWGAMFGGVGVAAVGGLAGGRGVETGLVAAAVDKSANAVLTAGAGTGAGGSARRPGAHRQ
jgi:hypothetical protein